MKKLLLLTLLSFNLFGGCLEVGTVTGQSCTNDTVRVDAISKVFTTNMQVSDNNLKVLEIPLYIFSDAIDEIKMTINDVLNLQNSNSEVISTKFEYIQGGSVVVTIVNGTPFTLLAENVTGRNGNTEVGRIRITVNTALSDTQTAGIYKLSKSMTVKLGNGSDSSSATLSSSGTVDQVSMVGFENMATYKTGQSFKDGTVDYGNFVLNATNQKIKELFVKNNTTGTFQIKFNTSSLFLDGNVNSEYSMDMSYYYKKIDASEQPINDNEFFTIMTGKKNGSKVGEMRFVTEPLTGSLIAGEYKAVINVTVQAQ